MVDLEQSSGHGFGGFTKKKCFLNDQDNIVLTRKTSMG
jgi:hypothetical protein